MIDFAWVGRAMLHPTALRVLAYAEGATEPFSPNQLATEFNEPLGNISYHVLNLAGAKKHSKFRDKPLLELVDTQPRRGAVEHFYRLAEGQGER